MRIIPERLCSPQSALTLPWLRHVLTLLPDRPYLPANRATFREAVTTEGNQGLAFAREVQKASFFVDTCNEVPVPVSFGGKDYLILLGIWSVCEVVFVAVTLVRVAS